MTVITPIPGIVCAAHRCASVIPKGRFMCDKHWLMVPWPTRQELQLRADRDKGQWGSSAAWLTSAHRAVRAVALKELGLFLQSTGFSHLLAGLAAARAAAPSPEPGASP